MIDAQISEFLNQLASRAPTPGGGSVAALTGAQAAALVCMVCHLTIGKKKYAEHEDELRGILAVAESLQAELTALIDADIQAYDGLSAAYAIPKEEAGRAAAIQRALGPATEVPLCIAEASAAVLDLVPAVVEKGSTLAVSDAGMAALLAAAALRSGALNAYINLAATTDTEVVAAVGARLDAALSDRAAIADRLYRDVVERIGG
jgi:formiminotetrahydrofolate cyclodeaminase